jgi:hypothetical protein
VTAVGGFAAPLPAPAADGGGNGLTVPVDELETAELPALAANDPAVAVGGRTTETGPLFDSGPSALHAASRPAISAPVCQARSGITLSCNDDRDRDCQSLHASALRQLQESAI